MLTTQKQICAAFWRDHQVMEDQARCRGTFTKGQNAQVADTRVAFCDYVDMLSRSGEISQALTQRVTL